MKYVSFPVLVFALIGIIFVVAGISDGLDSSNRIVLAGGFLLSVSIAVYYGNTLRDYQEVKAQPTKSDQPQLVLFLIFVVISACFAIVLWGTLEWNRILKFIAVKRYYRTSQVESLAESRSAGLSLLEKSVIMCRLWIF